MELKMKRLSTLVKNEIFKSFIIKNSYYCSGGNIKLGKEILTWSKLYNNIDFTVNDVMPGVTCKCSGSCGNYCKGCSKTCYVKKSYDLHGASVIKGHARRTIATRFYINELQERLSLQLSRKRGKAACVRIHQSGEIESLSELIMHKNIAAEHPETVFFMYTKAFDIVIPYIIKHAAVWPDNFIILISIWNEYGIKEYNSVKHLPFIKAFICNTGYNYQAAGIECTTTCKAYNGKKLNHEITCFRCKKCFDKNINHKTILCDEH